MSHNVRFVQIAPWLLLLSVLVNVGVLAGYLIRHSCCETPAEQMEAKAGAEAAAPSMQPGAPATPADRFVAELGRFTTLQPQQEQTIAAARAELFKSIEATKGSMKELKQRMVDLMTVDAPDMASLREVTKRLADAQLVIQDQTVDHLLQVRQGLSKEQRQGFDSMLKKRMCPNPMCSGACVGKCPGCAAGNHGKGPGHAPGCSCGGGVPFVPGDGMGGGGCSAGDADIQAPRCGAHVQ